MRILHTSDWHLGRALYGQKRYEEFDALLDWMINTLQAQRVDVLLIAGDVFDSGTPSNRAMQQYYRFLTRVSGTHCRHVVIIGGNHDSPTFLNAPRELLKVLNVHVVGAKADNVEDEVIVLRNADQRAEAIICATPYLRDRDIRSTEAGESIEDKAQKLLEGIQAHYAAVTAHAEALHAALPSEDAAHVPIIAMGHLFTAGGRTTDGDGVRDLYVGSIAHVGANIFPSALDYVALGHLHLPQNVGGRDHIRYSGSPIAMGFGEALQQKSVCLMTFDQRKPELTLIDIPVFQRLRQLRGNLQRLLSDLQHLVQNNISTWVEVMYTGDDIVPDLREQLDHAVSPDNTNQRSPVTILRIKNQRSSAQLSSGEAPQQTLDDLTPQDVFEKCLDANKVASEQRPALQLAWQEILQQLQEHDTRAE
ncbi:exonuclease subunit SbcD [Gammaproteobacteria bacterium LSUCC0112]|nr:exonuclease subunit SbcD [Gammaproteobacteria bacterium LSUCC0112]